MALFAIAGISSGVLLLALQSHLSFVGDDWDFLIYRRGFSVGTFLEPHNEHISIIPVAVYKLLLSIFGMGSALPFQIASTSLFLLSSVLLFIYLRSCIGEWLALFATCLVLFLGPAWIDLLWAFQIGSFGATSAGIGMLLMLQRGDRKGDRIACLLLLVSLAFSSLGLAFAAGAGVDWLLGRRPRLKRAFIPFVPVALFVLWYIGWGHHGATGSGFSNIGDAPKYVIDAVSQVLASLAGLASQGDDASHPSGISLRWGHFLLVALAILACVRLVKLKRVPRGLLLTVAVGAGFWGLAALNGDPLFRPPTNGRYQYPGAIFILLICGELLRGARINFRWIVVTGVATVVALVSNIGLLHDGYTVFKPQSDAGRAQLAAVEIARGTVRDDFAFSLLLQVIDAASYFSAIDAFGSPAMTEEELASSADEIRGAADLTLAPALRLRLVAIPSSSVSYGSQQTCRVIPRSRSGATSVQVGPGRLTMSRATSPVLISLERFANKYPIAMGTLSPGGAVTMKIPPDRSSRLWRMRLESDGRSTLCTTGSLITG